MSFRTDQGNLSNREKILIIPNVIVSCTFGHVLLQQQIHQPQTNRKTLPFAHNDTQRSWQLAVGSWQGWNMT